MKDPGTGLIVEGIVSQDERKVPPGNSTMPDQNAGRTSSQKKGKC